MGVEDELVVVEIGRLGGAEAAQLLLQGVVVDVADGGKAIW